MNQDTTKVILLGTSITIIAIRLESLVGSRAPTLFPDPEYPHWLWVGKRSLISNSD